MISIYGITSEEYYAILKNQGNVCYICRRAKGTGRKRLSVDHCHKTGVIRGVICSTDNVMLGRARDEVEYFERAIEYLKNPPAFAIVGQRVAPIELEKLSHLTLNEEQTT